MNGSARGGRVTLTDIARRAGVSIATASKVLNGRQDVAPETRRRVETVMRERGYPPFLQRVRHDRQVIELVIDPVITPYLAEMLEGVLTEAATLEVDVAVELKGLDERSGRAAGAPSWPERIRVRGRAGAIVVTPELSREQSLAFREAGVPLVVIDPVSEVSEDIVSIGATNWQGGVAATNHLIELGHTAIGFAGGLRRSMRSQTRFHGYQAALQEAGIAPSPEFVWNGQSFDYATGTSIGRMLLGGPRRPTAVFAASDAIAAGIIEVLWRARMRVPDELSIVAFDDTSQALTTTPPLTTVRQPLREMGAAALRTVVEHVEGRAPQSHHVELATQLVVRESTAPAPVP